MSPTEMGFESLPAHFLILPDDLYKIVSSGYVHLRKSMSSLGMVQTCSKPPETQAKKFKSENRILAWFSKIRGGA